MGSSSIVVKSSAFDRNMVNYARWAPVYETVTILNLSTLKY